MSTQHFCIIQLRQLGDILLTTPVCQVLKELDPKCKITFISHQMGRLILSDNPYIDELLTYDDKDNWIKKLHFLKAVRKQKFDFLFDFMNNPKSGFFTILALAKNKISYKSKRAFFYDRTFKVKEDKQYIVDEKIALIEKSLGIQVNRPNLCLPWAPENATSLKLYLDSLEKEKPRIILSPTHRRKNRQWQKEKFCQLADQLVQTYDANIIWLWGPGEKEFVEEHMSICKEKTRLAPQTEFAQMAALMSNCDLFVGTSNGPSHVAVSTNIPSLQLHGHTNVHSWCPLNKIHLGIQSCEWQKSSQPTLKSIEVEEVFKYIGHLKQHVERSMQLRLSKEIITDWQARPLEVYS